MSQWRLLVREVYQAGGDVPVRLLGYYSSSAMTAARQHGLIEHGTRGGVNVDHRAVLTDRGRAFAEGRLTTYVPYVGHGTNGGRASGTTLHWRATWLAALPVGVRLTHGEHRAQNDGTCYW